MHANPASANVETVTLPMGNGWRVRIADGERLQFVGSFDEKHRAVERVRNSSSGWLARLREIATRR